MRVLFFLVVFLISANRKQLLKVTVYFKMPYASAVLWFCALNFDPHLHASIHMMSFFNLCGRELPVYMFALETGTLSVRECLM